MLCAFLQELFYVWLKFRKVEIEMFGLTQFERAVASLGAWID